jgi:hypothetical protein
MKVKFFCCELCVVRLGRNGGVALDVSQRPDIDIVQTVHADILCQMATSCKFQAIQVRDS